MDEIKKQKILIDSCILIYCGSEDRGPKTQELLETLDKNENRLGTSELCRFEVLKNCQHQANFDYYKQLLDKLYPADVNRGCLINAANLCHIHFKQGKVANDGKKEKQTGDLIIGGTVMYHKALLLTSNGDDFPISAWERVAHTNIVHLDNKTQKYVLTNIYLLRFKESVFPTDRKLYLKQ